MPLCRSPMYYCRAWYLLPSAHVQVSNWIQTRLDGFNLMEGVQRPFPVGAQDIGTWQSVFELVLKGADLHPLILKIRNFVHVTPHSSYDMQSAQITHNWCPFNNPQVPLPPMQRWSYSPWPKSFPPIPPRSKNFGFSFCSNGCCSDLSLCSSGLYRTPPLR